MQTLVVEGFLGLKEAKIELNSVTVIIGEQATGKSIVARLFFFFNEYLANFDKISHLTELKKNYDEKMTREFSEIFPSYSWEESKFEIEYTNSEHRISLSSAKKSNIIKINTSKSIADFSRNLKKQYRAVKSEFDEEQIGHLRMSRAFRLHQREVGMERHESALFVPAARSFYATLRDEIFSLLALESKLEKIIIQFGDFYERAKLRHDIVRDNLSPGTARQVKRRELSLHRRIEEENRYFSDIVKGNFKKIGGRDWLVLDSGDRIEMSRASSGQQEATPLLMAISQFPSRNRTLIIEEPEAHLFPSAQVKILDYIILQAIRHTTSVLFTTHSPYLLSAINNFLIRDKANMKPSLRVDQVRSYSLDGGYSSSLIDQSSELISADYIDSVSEDIAAEFEIALGAINENL